MRLTARLTGRRSSRALSPAAQARAPGGCFWLQNGDADAIGWYSSQAAPVSAARAAVPPRLESAIRRRVRLLTMVPFASPGLYSATSRRCTPAGGGGGAGTGGAGGAATGGQQKCVRPTLFVAAAVCNHAVHADFSLHCGRAPSGPITGGGGASLRAFRLSTIASDAPRDNPTNPKAVLAWAAWAAAHRAPASETRPRAAAAVLARVAPAALRTAARGRIVRERVRAGTVCRAPNGWTDGRICMRPHRCTACAGRLFAAHDNDQSY